MAAPPATPLQHLLTQATRLYSPPTVAMEVVRLTSQPSIDVAALRDCIARDPALTAKLLRVVNSSVYGLRGEVSDLNQAIALLGVTPLKLLVLGFSLPDGLLDDVSADGLRRYWTDTLTRAAAAREIASLGWRTGADEAQLAGLMQGLGQLVLLSQLGESYASVLERADAESATGDSDPALLARVELQSLGFDHRSLTSELLRGWSLPDVIVDAIALQATPEAIAAASVGPLPKVLRLADLLARLVGRRQLSALPALVEEGLAYCRLTRRQINTLVETLQPNVDQLAAAMAVELEGDRDYAQTLLEAYAQLAVVSENGAVRMLSGGSGDDEAVEDDRLCDEVLADANELGNAVKSFLESRRRDTDADPGDAPASVAHAGRSQPRRPHHRPPPGGEANLLAEAKRIAAGCRQKRMPLTLVVVAVGAEGGALQAPGGTPPWLSLREWLTDSPWSAETAAAVYVPLAGDRFAVLLPEVERVEATRLLTHASDAWGDRRGESFDAGVASITLVSKGFDVGELLVSAERCLSAAQSSASDAVKSIEVY